MEAYELAHELIKEEFGDIEIWTCNAHIFLDENGIPGLSFWFEKNKDDDRITRAYKFGSSGWYKVNTR